MKRLLLLILVAACSSLSPDAMSADNHKGHDREKYEHRDHRPDNYRHDNRGRGHSQKEYKKAEKRHDKYVKQQRKISRKRHPDHELQKMIRYATRGSRDVKVWRINNDTYIVRFFRNGKFYTQKLYPFSGRYGAPGVISINWTPESFWTLIPSVNINIPLN